ncbi:hypothetical protein ACTXT7_011195 [Hymenolepis weldensis]
MKCETAKETFKEVTPQTIPELDGIPFASRSILRQKQTDDQIYEGYIWDVQVSNSLTLKKTPVEDKEIAEEEEEQEEDTKRLCELAEEEESSGLLHPRKVDSNLADLDMKKVGKSAIRIAVIK